MPPAAAAALPPQGILRASLAIAQLKPMIANTAPAVSKYIDSGKTKISRPAGPKNSCSMDMLRWKRYWV